MTPASIGRVDFLLTMRHSDEYNPLYNFRFCKGIDEEE